MMRVAVIDDNEAWGFALACSLEQVGFKAKAFQDPFQFIPVAHQFDLALVDFCLPGRSYQRALDGAELICKLKSELGQPPLLVLMSAFFTNDMLCSAEGICPSADAVLSKGAGLKSILESVDQILATRSGIKSFESQGSTEELVFSV
ncbi:MULTISPECIES: response regulator [Cyanophyceae]|uniref:Response regulator n=1 Tax=Leptolyngbya subtilissima DQ-A4 TaxID=2933933 RepID=A0ABV0KAE9_9CYAN|nr:response regulator [Nodosilinea sp. FACHB-141]MBD2113719.1 response regulator [Nodosilinea sp. FACHB-141]